MQACSECEVYCHLLHYLLLFIEHCAHCAKSTTQNDCNANSKRSDIGAGSDIYGNILIRFHELGEHPVSVNIRALDEDGGIGLILRRHNVQWHPSCRLKCTTSGLAKTQRTVVATTELGYQPYMCRQKSHWNRPAQSICYFCDDPANNFNTLHEAMTFKVTERVKQCALKLQDQKLIAKLS